MDFYSRTRSKLPLAFGPIPTSEISRTNQREPPACAPFIRCPRAAATATTTPPTTARPRPLDRTLLRSSGVPAPGLYQNLLQCVNVFLVQRFIPMQFMNYRIVFIYGKQPFASPLLSKSCIQFSPGNATTLNTRKCSTDCHGVPLVFLETWIRDRVCNLKAISWLQPSTRRPLAVVIDFNFAS
jgi:hypothetical protein